MGLPVARRNAMLDLELAGTMYLALFIVAPNNEGVGGTEVSAIDYARLEVNLSTLLDEAENGIKVNLINVEWPAAAQNSWGTVVRPCLFTAQTGGTFRARSDNAISKLIEAGDIPRFAAGEMQFGLGNKVA